jgi:hypothetical protein
METETDLDYRELARLGFRGAGTRVRHREFGPGHVSLVGPHDVGLLWDRDTGWVRPQRYAPDELLAAARDGRIAFVG